MYFYIMLSCSYLVVFIFMPLLLTKLYAVLDIFKLSAQTNQLCHIVDNLNILNRKVRISFREVLFEVVHATDDLWDVFYGESPGHFVDCVPHFQSMRETSHEEDCQWEHEEAEEDVNPEDLPVVLVVRVEVCQGCPTEFILQLMALEVERQNDATGEDGGQSDPQVDIIGVGVRLVFILLCPGKSGQERMSCIDLAY